MIQLKKFTLGDDWVPKKLDVAIDVPDILDLEDLRGRGLQPGEEQLPENRIVTGDECGNVPGGVHARSNFEFDPVVLVQLTEMGFSLDACKRAIYTTQNQGTEAAMNWMLEHMGDPDFNDPFTVDSGASGSLQSHFTPDSGALASIIAMGIPEEQAIRALKATVRELFNI